MVTVFRVCSVCVFGLGTGLMLCLPKDCNFFKILQMRLYLENPETKEILLYEPDGLDFCLAVRITIASSLRKFSGRIWAIVFVEIMFAM